MSDRFFRFRELHKTFNYTSHSVELTGGCLDITFAFDIDGIIHFKPSLRFPEPEDGWKIDPTGPLASKLAFYVGMVEVASYWKAYCPAQLNILAHSLCNEEIAWWKKLYYLGLGEFFHRNNIETNSTEFLSIIVENEARPQPVQLPRSDRNLIPVGGGKDSIVSLELLRPVKADSSVLLLNAPRAARNCAGIAGYSDAQIIEVKRTIDPLLLSLNAQGALNGHTPFSALLAFVSIFTAALTGASYIALSNESSANEPTVLGSDVNHQYSKSFEFERDFRDYTEKFITPDIEYFSLLRPVNELQIASLMSTYTDYLQDFRSCNVGSREGRWCGRCPKCLFTYIMLQPFCLPTTLTSIFGHDLLDDASLESTMQELLGCSASKPFECVGTVDEVRAAISLVISGQQVTDTPRRLLEFVKLRHPDVLVSKETAMSMLREWNDQHCLPPSFERRLLESPLFQS